MKKNTKGMSAGKKVAIGAGIAAASAGAFYLLGPKGKKHQKEVKDLMAKMKKEVVAKASKVKDMTEPLYNDAIDALATNYSKKYKAHEKDIKAFSNTLKAEWKGAKKVVKKSVKTAKKIVK